MGPISRWEQAVDWLSYLPIRLAYRIVWLVARTGNRNAVAVYRAMWDAQLDLPRIAALTTNPDPSPGVDTGERE